MCVCVSLSLSLSLDAERKRAMSSLPSSVLPPVLYTYAKLLHWRPLITECEKEGMTEGRNGRCEKLEGRKEGRRKGEKNEEMPEKLRFD